MDILATVGPVFWVGDMYETFLHKIPLFAELPWNDLSRLCGMIHEVRLEAGQILFREGDTADMAYITYEGELEVVKTVDGREIQLDIHRTPGIVIGESALVEESTRLATIRAVTASFVLGLSRFQVQELLTSSPAAAQIILQILTSRARNIEAHVRHDERMAQLGTMTAGLAHELNNPASAVMRSANQLQAAQARSEEARLALEQLELTAEQRIRIAALVDLLREKTAKPLLLDVLLRSDREAEIEDWLADKDIDKGWEFTPPLVSLGLDMAALESLTAEFPGEQTGVLICWLAAAFTSQSLLIEIAQGAGRIVNIVRALKSYVYLDQAPVQNVDIEAGLEDTLLVMSSQFPAGVVVRREYAADLPRIAASGSDLNQVWTTIIDNALDALDGQGEIVVRTRVEGQMVVVAIEDNGPGIAPEHLPKVFGPFFTTKPPGKGTGLGLTMAFNIVTIQGGEINVTSSGGRTVFEVRLPVDKEAADG